MRPRGWEAPDLFKEKQMAFSLEDDVKMCNCAGCGCDLLGESMHGVDIPKKVRKDLPPFVRGRILERPYCGPCLATMPRSSLVDRFTPGDPDPSRENAVRALEEDR
jgi:hypothetical protein